MADSLLTPDLEVDLEFLERQEIGLGTSMPNGFQASCVLTETERGSVAICAIVVDGDPIRPGEWRRVSLVLEPPESAARLREARRFFLRIGHLLVAKATVVSDA